MGELILDPDNVIKLWTRNGDCEIQLLSGDITLLPVEQKMDILMVSAFPGDYSPMNGTVIGALKSNLGISVQRLSEHKDLDLRHHFSCWLSKPITTPNTPFSRLLCFERRRGNFTVAQQISDMFRVFVPVFNNQENTVITPLLATGHQGFDKAGICGAMVDAAAHWIRAGLPLRCLKIVLYWKIDKEVSTMFQALKIKLMAQNEKLKRSVFSKTYDVYISFSPDDQSWVNKIKHTFEKKKGTVKVYAQHQSFDQTKVWQNNIFKIMVGCKRIIAVLTPAFLESSECLEQYNMAMCCNRLVGMEVLAPFYIQTVTSLPTYMGLVQWVDCRVRKEGDSTEEKLSSACSIILEQIDDPMLTMANGDTIKYKQQLTPAVEDVKFKYDVFISYSHKNPDQAEALLQAFAEINDKVKVFYDRSALTTGSNWQDMLYQCMGQAKCVIALMSPTYLSSTVCKEEYNIALARFLTEDDNMQFIPVCISDIEEIPAAFAQIKMVDARGDNFENAKEKIAKAVVDLLEGESPKRYEELLNTVVVSYEIEDMLNVLRSSEVAAQYTVTQKDGLRRHPPLIIDNKDERPTVLDQDQENIEDFDIALCYANDAINLAGAFCYLIDKLYNGLNISVFTHTSHARLKALDSATRVVLFLSQDFIKTEHFMQELHQALSRQRPEERRILYLIKVNKLPRHPFFPNLLPYDLSGTDKIWFDLEKKFRKGNKAAGTKRIVSTSRMEFAGNFSCDYAEYFAMTKAAEDVLASILKQSAERPHPNQINIVEVEMKLDSDKIDLLNQSLPLRQCLKETPCITSSTSEEKTAHDSKMKEGNQKIAHPRAGTPEKAHPRARTPEEANPRTVSPEVDHPRTGTQEISHHRVGTPEIANEKQDKGLTATSETTGSKMIDSGTENRQASQQQEIVEHPGTRHTKENGRNEKQENFVKDSQVMKVKSAENDETTNRTGKKDTKSNPKTSKSCVLI